MGPNHHRRQAEILLENEVVPRSLRLGAMRDREPQPALVRTRDDLMKLIADAIRIQLTHLSKENAMAVADTILRTFKMAGLSIRARRKPE